MSRIIVKNLPKNVTEEKLRNIFGQTGLITDVQLKFTPDGKFRQFAFLGFQNENEAEDAIKAFNNTCINTTKITVEACALLGDVKKPRAWSKYAQDSSAYKKLHHKSVLNNEVTKTKKDKKKQKQDEVSSIIEKYKDDPLFEEFLQLQGGEKLQKVLAALKKKDEKEITDSDHESENEIIGKYGYEIDIVEDKNEVDNLIAKNTEISDLEYLQLLKEEKSEPRKQTEKKLKEKIDLYTAKLKGLPYNCKKKDIKQFFHPLSLYSLRIPRNIKGIAFVGFKTEDKLRKALMKDKSILAGKRIFVTKYINEHKEEEKDEIQGTHQKKWKLQEESLKNEESIAEFVKIFLRNLAYTMTENDIQELFSKYGPLAEVNVPIDNISRKPKGFGVVTFVMPQHAVQAYSELDGTIQQGRLLHLLPGKTKEENDNVDADDDNSSNFKKKKAAKQKSQAGQTHNWNSLFLGHDAVANVIADRYGTSKEAVLDPHGSSNAAVRLALGETQIVATTRKYLEQEGVKLDAFNLITTKRSKTIILVKNLPANTLPKELHDLFSKYGIIGRLILPPNGITALVEFLEPSEARKAFSKLAYSKFKYLPLYLEWAPEDSLLPNTKSNRKVQVKTKQTGTKILVRNIPFQANKTEIYELFKTFGEIKALRLPKKMTPGADSHRGFCFVDFVVNSDAKKAFEALCQSTHLYGRRLVLEWASQEDGVDELRKRTADQFYQIEKIKSRKSVIDFDKL